MTKSTQYEIIADHIWNPADPLACEAAVTLREAGRLQRLHDRSTCTRIKRAARAILNAIWFFRARRAK